MNIISTAFTFFKVLNCSEKYTCKSVSDGPNAIAPNLSFELLFVTVSGLMLFLYLKIARHGCGYCFGYNLPKLMLHAMCFKPYFWILQTKIRQFCGNLRLDYIKISYMTRMFIPAKLVSLKTKNEKHF